MNHKDTKAQREAISEELNELSRHVVDAAFCVHRELGPGLLESVYEACLCHELSKRGLKFERQVTIPLTYDGMKIEAGLRIDVWVDKKLILELKAVETLHDIHKAQLLTYLKLTKCRLGLLINFNVPMIKDGIKRVIL